MDHFKWGPIMGVRSCGPPKPKPRNSNTNFLETPNLPFNPQLMTKPLLDSPHPAIVPLFDSFGLSHPLLHYGDPPQQPLFWTATSFDPNKSHYIDIILMCSCIMGLVFTGLSLHA